MQVLSSKHLFTVIWRLRLDGVFLAVLSSFPDGPHKTHFAIILFPFVSLNIKNDSKPLQGKQSTANEK